MRITGTGLVGIGTTSPFTTSKVGITGSSTDSDSVVDMTKGSSTNTTSQVFQRFFISAGGNGSITGNGAAAATFTAYSDRRLKENIQSLPSQLENIMLLKPCEFAEGDDGMLQIAGWSKQEARLVSALQGAVEKINQLETRIAALEG